MKLHEPTEVFEDDVRAWQMMIPCECGREIDLWFFSYPGDSEMEAKAIHYSDVSGLRSSALDLGHVIALLGEVMKRFRCDFPWGWETTGELSRVRL